MRDTSSHTHIYILVTYTFILLNLLNIFKKMIFMIVILHKLLASIKVPLAQRIARWTSNPKVAGSIPARDDVFCIQ